MFFLDITVIDFLLHTTLAASVLVLSTANLLIWIGSITICGVDSKNLYVGSSEEMYFKLSTWSEVFLFVVVNARFCFIFIFIVILCLFSFCVILCIIFVFICLYAY